MIWDKAIEARYFALFTILGTVNRLRSLTTKNTKIHERDIHKIAQSLFFFVPFRAFRG